MALLVVSCLALFVVVYLVTIAVQAIRIEKSVMEMSRYLENRLAREFQNEE